MSLELLIVTSEFPPEPGVSGRMACDLAEYLKAQGHRAKVVCPYPSRPSGAYYPNGNGHRVSEEAIQGVPVVRVPSHLAPESRFGPRMLESWSFGRWSSRMLSAHQPRPDAIYSVTWPMLGQACISARAAKLGIPHVTHIMDLYPESALVKVAPWMQQLTARPLYALDRWNAFQADRLLVISENMRQTYITTRGLPAERVEVIHTWQDESLFLKLPERSEAARIYGIKEDCFTFLFLGNIGPVAGVEHLIHCFAEAGLKESQLVIVGEGTEKRSCVQLAAGTGANVRFLSEPRLERVPLLQSLADVCLLPVRRGAAFTSIPSKLGSYLLSEKPVLASVDEDTESGRVIAAADCGWVVRPQETKELSDKMRAIARMPAGELAVRGRRGREYALEHLSKCRGVRRLASVLLEAAAQKANANGSN
jgi:glycosyltransferase involved in cell wall biosynthesis